jgi:hypothetical protein
MDLYKSQSTQILQTINLKIANIESILLTHTKMLNTILECIPRITDFKDTKPSEPSNEKPEEVVLFSRPIIKFENPPNIETRQKSFTKVYDLTPTANGNQKYPERAEPNATPKSQGSKIMTSFKLFNNLTKKIPDSKPNRMAATFRESFDISKTSNNFRSTAYTVKHNRKISVQLLKNRKGSFEIGKLPFKALDLIMLYLGNDYPTLALLSKGTFFKLYKTFEEAMDTKIEILTQKVIQAVLLL